MGSGALKGSHETMTKLFIFKPMILHDKAAASQSPWLSLWLALLPIVYVISPLAVFRLPHLKRIPRPSWLILIFYALSQQLPAIFAPDPLQASVLACLRTLLIFGMLSVGIELGKTSRLQPLIIGFLVVFLIAFVWSFIGQQNLLLNRLTHPYMTPITVALAATILLWLMTFIPMAWYWRVPGILLSAVVLLLTGSRGPLLAAGIGLVAGLLLTNTLNMRPVLLMMGVAVIVTGATIIFAERQQLDTFLRFSAIDANDRDLIWNDTLSIIGTAPWTGVGSYRLGHYLQPDTICEGFPNIRGEVQPCPAWIASLGKPWLIAHNVGLQQWAETGPIGLLGLLSVLAVAIMGCQQNRDPLGMAIISGLLVSNLVDNTILLPSPFFAEIFWITVGIQLVHIKAIRWPLGWVMSTLMLLLCWPVLALLHTPKHTDLKLSFFQAANVVHLKAPYRVALRLQGHAGVYRVTLRQCQIGCVTVGQIVAQITAMDSKVIILQTRAYTNNLKGFEILVYPRLARINPQAIARYYWDAEVKP